VTAIPVGSGGKAPKREDFNGAFNMLSNIAFYAQKGWIFQWDGGQTYYAGCIVRYSGNLYECTADVTSTTAPSSDTSHWSKYNITPGTTYAPINSPAFTGTPTAPTPTSGDNSTKIATTEFVQSAIGASTGDVTIIYPNGGTASSPANITKNSRYVESNPYPGHHVYCRVEVYYSSKWGDPRWINFGDGTNTQYAYGAVASEFDGDIVVQTGKSHLMQNAANLSGDPWGGISGNQDTLPARVIVFKLG
jgi:hypothetical protein